MMRRLILAAAALALAQAATADPYTHSPGIQGTGNALPLAGGTLTGPLQLPAGSSSSLALRIGNAGTGVYQDGSSQLVFCDSSTSTPACGWNINAASVLKNFQTSSQNMGGTTPFLQMASASTTYDLGLQNYRSGNANGSGLIVFGRSGSGTIGTAGGAIGSGAGAVNAGYKVVGISGSVDDGAQTGGNIFDVTGGYLLGTVQGTLSTGVAPIEFSFWEMPAAGGTPTDNLCIGLDGPLYVASTGSPTLPNQCNTGKKFVDQNDNLFSLSATTPAMAAGTLALSGTATAPSLGANGEGWLGLSTSLGLQLRGQGSSNDFQIQNRNGTSVLAVATGGTTLFATGLNLGGTFQLGNTGGTATLSTGEMALAKITASGTAPTAGFLKLAAIAGTNAGTCKLIAYAGTSTTPVTVVDNVGAGC